MYLLHSPSGQKREKTISFLLLCQIHITAECKKNSGPMSGSNLHPTNGKSQQSTGNLKIIIYKQTKHKLHNKLKVRNSKKGRRREKREWV